MQISYLINQYPKVSHSFIRREILALERQGFKVQRIALRGWDEQLVDAQDQSEREKTQYILQNGIFALILALIKAIFTVPIKFYAALQLMLVMARQSDKSLAYHLAYLAEACCLLPWIKKQLSQHLHAHFGTNSAEIAMLASKLSGIPYSFTVHGRRV